MDATTLYRSVIIDELIGTHNYNLTGLDELLNSLECIMIDVFFHGLNENIYYTIIDGRFQWIFYTKDNEGIVWCNGPFFWKIIINVFSSIVQIDNHCVAEFSKLYINNRLKTDYNLFILFDHSDHNLVDHALFEFEKLRKY